MESNLADAMPLTASINIIIYAVKTIIIVCSGVNECSFSAAFLGQRFSVWVPAPWRSGYYPPPRNIFWIFRCKILHSGALGKKIRWELRNGSIHLSPHSVTMKTYRRSRSRLIWEWVVIGGGQNFLFGFASFTGAGPDPKTLLASYSPIRFKWTTGILQTVV